MMHHSFRYLLLFMLSVTLLQAEEDMFDEDLEDILNMETELKAEVGSRSGERNFLESRFPVDVITWDQIEHSGLTSLTDVLRYFVPGFNAPETSVADGTDHVRAITLRGMSPDQILVLINGKRVHTSSLLHVNGTIGRGSSNVDLDTIAVKGIEKIEILRDGAAAQYGSDAISGVINIILKGVGHKSSISAKTGKTTKGDGASLYGDAFLSAPLKYDGFANLTLTAQQQNKTQRAGTDNRLSPPQVRTHAGVPDTQSYQALYNVEAPQSGDFILYSDGTFNYRNGKASAFFRPSSESSEPLYSDGSLPIINAKIMDYGITAGVKGLAYYGIEWDLSNVYGSNSFEFDVYDSMNYSLGAASPTRFNNGTLKFIQNTTNLDLKKHFGAFDIAGGYEYRYEGYNIKSGDYASYYNSASQGFAGFRPENAVDSSRNSFAFYLDGVYYPIDSLSIELAGRYENFSDFGSTTIYKVAVGYKPVEMLYLRASGSTGFRAPSLAQSFYSQTSSFIDGESITTQGTFRVDHPVAQALGAQALTPEKSNQATVGTVIQPTKTISLTADYFYIDVKDRIMLSDDLAGSTPAQKAILEQYGVAKARFFTNAVNTNTQGFDIKFNIKHTFENDSKLDFTAWFNHNENTITGYNNGIISEEDSYAQVDRMENGQPKNALSLLTRYDIDPVDFTLNIKRYGDYFEVFENRSYKFNAAWTTDIDIAYNAFENFTVAIGGYNIFDTVPNQWDGLSGTFYGDNGIKPYSRYSPFGYSGTYYYARLTYEF